MLLHTRFGNPFRRLLLAAPTDLNPGGASPKATIEERLATAEQARDKAESDLKTARDSAASITTERDQLKTENTRLTEQFNSATKEAKDAQDKVTKLTTDLSTVTGERDTARTQLTTANTNVDRLESLCQLKGVDSKQAVPTISEKSAAGNDLYKQWQELKKTDPAKATAFFRKHQSAMRGAQAEA